MFTTENIESISGLTVLRCIACQACQFLIAIWFSQRSIWWDQMSCYQRYSQGCKTIKTVAQTYAKNSQMLFSL